MKSVLQTSEVMQEEYHPACFTKAESVHAPDSQLSQKVGS